MSDVLTGNPANITTPLTATVTTLANNGSGAIRVTTSLPHLFGNEDNVFVNAGSTDAEFVITVIDSTHFDLQGSTYTSGGSGTATDYSLSPQILVPTDGDTFSAQLSGLLSSQTSTLDRTQFLQEEIISINQSGLQSVTFLASGSVTVPEGALIALVTMCGGGGGGAAGASLGGNQPNLATPAGGGGAGAQLSTQFLPVTPGDVLSVTVGAGGGGSPTGDGSGGGTSIVHDLTSGLSVSALGGSGGTYGALGVAMNSSNIGTQGGLDLYSLGGEGVGGNPLNPFGDGGTGVFVPVLEGSNPNQLGTIHMPSSPGSGGSGYASAYYQTASPSAAFPGGYAGRYSVQGYAGGAGGGAVSVSSGGSNYYSGGSAGGGGGGPFGVGAAGGNPGTGNSSGTGGNGTSGSAAAANTGAGGGGGGGGGCGSSSGGSHGTGGSGGSGQVRITWFVMQNLRL